MVLSYRMGNFGLSGLRTKSLWCLILHLGTVQIELERIRVIESPGVPRRYGCRQEAIQTLQNISRSSITDSADRQDLGSCPMWHMSKSSMLDNWPQHERFGVHY